MIVRISFLILTSFIFFSCKRKPEAVTPNPNVQAVVTVCINETFGKTDSARYYKKLMPILNGEPHPERIKKYNDSIRFLLDTAVVYLIVKDSLGQVSRGDKEDLESFLKIHFTDFDSSKFLVKPTYLFPSPQILNLHILEKAIHMQVRSKEEGINDKVRIIGKCIFSNVIFNQRKTNAAVLLNYMIDRHTGYGDIFLLKRENKTWKVVIRQRTWVS